MLETPMDRRGFLGHLPGLVAIPGLLRAPRSATDAPPIPGIGPWFAKMIKFGKIHAAGLKSTAGPLDPLLGATYYDAQRVFYQIGDFSADPSWQDAANHAMTVYRDRYVLENKGGVPGHWIFPHGIAEHYRRTKDPKSREALVLLSRNAAFARDSTPADWTRETVTSREVAYNIHNLLKAEEVGEPHRARLPLLVDQALGHIDQWFVSRKAPFCKPFMFGLTAEALIAYHTKTGDKRIPDAVKTGTDWLWKHAWSPQARAFVYLDREVKGEGGPDPAPDLNHLIAPAYAWLYRRTGEVRYREQGDAIFSGGVDQAYLTGAKQFNQGYRWSFDYVLWRREGDLTHHPREPRAENKG